MKYLLLLVLAGCAPYMLATRSGKPEAVVFATKKQISEDLINQLVTDGFVIEQQTENLVSGSMVERNIWTGAIRHTKQYSITTEGDSTRIILHYLLGGSPVATQRFLDEQQAELTSFAKRYR